MHRSPFFRLLATTSLTAFAGTALADVSAGDVWANWQEQLSAYGDGQITIGGETYSGKSLTVDGITISAETNGSASTIAIPQIILTENGDGTVTVAFAPNIPITFHPDGPDNENLVEMVLQLVNGTVVVSGSPEAMVYDYSADRMTLSATQIIEDGAEVPADILLNANGLQGQSRQTAGDVRDLASSFAASSVDVLIGFDDGESRVDLSGRATNVTATSDARLGAGAIQNITDLRDIDGYLNASYQSGPGTFVLSVDEDGGATTIVLGTGSTSFDMAIAADSISMESLSSDVAMSLSGDEMPFPISLTARALGQSFAFPVISTDEPMPIGMTLNISDLSLDDQIWGILDPFGAVPHEPLTLQFGIDGTGRLLFDLDDPDGDEKIAAGESPLEIQSANISGLRLAFAGAELTGEGAFTFDNSDTETFPGLPRPEGRARLEAVGLNTMFDRLATVGLLPEEELMGFRLMLGMFADVVGDDHLVSQIEITPLGQILLNGQRLR